MDDNDSFGDASLFEEFEKDREQGNSFIRESDGVANYKNHNSEKVDEPQISRNDQICEENRPGGASNTSPLKSATARSTKDKFDRLLSPRLSSPGPAIQVLFTDSHLSRLHQSEILSFIASLLTSNKDDESHSSGKITSKNSVKLTSTEDEGSKVIGCVHFYKEFFFDLLGWPLVDYRPALTDSWDIPTYEQVFKSCLPYNSDEEDAVVKAKPRASCFNCDGDHNLSECQEPRDGAKIAQRIREFKASKGGGGSRYHIESDPRFTNFKPGVYSETLTKALGMRPSQLPLFIYRMRLLGYPPGHLKDAELKASGIAMFDKHGKEVNIDGDTMEEGEVDDKNDNSDIQYDVTKIIEYPGFNVPVPDHCSDDWRSLGSSPMNVSQSKVAFAEMIKHKKEVKEERGRKRQQVAEASKHAKRARTEADMDTANSDDEGELNNSFRPPLPIETPPRTPVAPPLPVSTPPVTPSTSLGNPPLPTYTPPVTPMAPPLPEETPSPSPKFTLGEDGSPSSPEDANDNQGAVPKEIPLDSVDSQSDSEPASRAKSNMPSRTASTLDFTDLEEQRSSLLKELEQMENDDSQSSVLSNSADSSQVVRYSTPVTNRSVSVELGTPILQADSPAGLPSFDKFAVGITDHIPFENLPNATGTYNKLQDVLKQSRVSKSK